MKPRASMPSCWAGEVRHGVVGVTLARAPVAAVRAPAPAPALALAPLALDLALGMSFLRFARISLRLRLFHINQQCVL